MSDTKELIAEARQVAGDPTFNGTHRRDLFLELADALAAAQADLAARDAVIDEVRSGLSRGWGTWGIKCIIDRWLSQSLASGPTL